MGISKRKDGSEPAKAVAWWPWSGGSTGGRGNSVGDSYELLSRHEHTTGWQKQGNGSSRPVFFEYDWQRGIAMEQHVSAGHTRYQAWAADGCPCHRHCAYLHL